MMREVFLANAYADKGLVTEALQALIDKASEVGGQVRFGPGNYETATLYMKSGVSLYLDAGARIIGTADYTAYSNDYPYLNNPDLNEVTGKPRWHDALINCGYLKDIAIEGHGLIDGADVINPEGEQEFRGPMMLMIHHCENVSIKGVTLLRAANYATFFDTCTNVLLENVRAYGGQDALRLFRTKNVEVSHCDFRTGDDCVSGSLNADVYLHDTLFNSPGGNIVLLGCRNLHMKKCKVWSQGEAPAVFKDDKRYSNGWNAIIMLHDIGQPEYLMSDNWLIEDVEVENVETVFRYDRELFFGNGNNGKVTLKNVKAKNFVFPITVNGAAYNEFEMTIEGGHFIRSTLDKREDKAFLRAKNFKKIAVRDVVLENVDDEAFFFENGGEVEVKDAAILRKVSSISVENIEKSSVENSPVETMGNFFVYGDVDSIYVPKDQDESFLGARKYIG
ncbi:MAG: right-handed parallel beta-helix repeat-containing protein [Christensenellaceae bacterium]|nr:right-handed parallel beta-helix repeat-containing protein [Christensenellaceae bacterium]